MIGGSWTIFSEVPHAASCLPRLLRAPGLRRRASAQQRPLVTEDPEPIGAGRVLIEGGIDYAHDYQNIRYRG